MTETLFNPKEMYTLTRPTKISKKREEEFLRESAQWIIDHEYADDYEIEEVIADLRKLLPFSRRDGYQLCKKLERHSEACYEEFDDEFVEFMQCLSVRYAIARDKDVQEWIVAIGLKPLRKIGDKLPDNPKLKSRLLRGQPIDGIDLYITAISENMAKYLVNTAPDKLHGGYYVDFEEIDPITPQPQTK